MKPHFGLGRSRLGRSDPERNQLVGSDNQATPTEADEKADEKANGERSGGASAGQSGSMSSLVSTIGYILAVSYPVLAISTGTRAVYQLFFKEGVVYYWPSILSGIAALCYLTAAIGFAYRRRWSWRLSVGVLLFESAMTLLVGIWSFIDPPAVGSTVWRHFGADYGYFPFFQPLLGLIWLFWPETMREYGISWSLTGHKPAQAKVHPHG